MKTRTLLLPLAIALSGSVTSLAQPSNLMVSPATLSVSVGATATFRVRASGASPFTYQWWFTNAFGDNPIDGVANPSALRNILNLTNVQVAAAGGYHVVVTDTNSLSATSGVANLEVDPTFTKISAGPVVTDIETTGSAVWWDYDNDGFQDLLVSRFTFPPTYSVPNTLYHNDGDGTFSRVTTNAIVTTLGSYFSGTVGDFNNDGLADLFAADHGPGGADDLFRNDGMGQFTRLTQAECGPLVSEVDYSNDATWVDSDCDGFLDLFTVNTERRNDCLYRNQGGGIFVKMSGQVGSLVADGATGLRCSWADYDNDGYPDVWVHNDGGLNFLHHNNGNGTFSRITEGSVPQEGFANVAGVWADYDNDGLLDLFTTGESVRVNSLHHNLGGNLFVDVAAGAGVAWYCGAYYAACGDYDNDGYLDLFVCRYPSDGPSVLFRNNGDGTFSSVKVGSPLIDGFERLGVAWGDYDNDGFLDLFITCGLASPSPNLLYRNNGNRNGWLKVSLIGTASNRSALGAKVRIQATIGGRTFWQMRELSGNTGLAGVQGLLAHFGLGDATKVDTLRIEWPSGIVQELKDVAIDQQPYLPVVESQNANPDRHPQVTAQSRDAAGVFHATVAHPTANLRCVLEASTNLVQWTKVQVRTNAPPVAMEFTDVQATNQPMRFYRVVVP